MVTVHEEQKWEPQMLQLVSTNIKYFFSQEFKPIWEKTKNKKQKTQKTVVMCPGYSIEKNLPNAFNLAFKFC